MYLNYKFYVMNAEGPFSSIFIQGYLSSFFAQNSFSNVNMQKVTGDTKIFFLSYFSRNFDQ